jgi:predicted ATP-dependent endonuclease of OLD family
MNYSKFTIKNFRCFTDEQSLKFAQPANGAIGSGITYIVGANNSGKTTLIEGLWLKKNHKIKSSEKKLGQKPEFCLYNSENVLKRKIFLIREESYTLDADPDITNNDELFEIVTSRRHWGSNAGAINSTKEVLVSTIVGETPRKPQSISTASILMKIESDQTRYEEFIKLVQRIIPEFTKWAVAYEDNEYIEYISGDGIKHKTDYLGDGVISVLRILAHLFEESTTALVIDEPELSLHPLAQKKLIKLIAEYAQNRQIIISTHSPYFISWEYIKNGAVLNKLVKVTDTNSKIHTISDYDKYSHLISGGNWQQPFLMDIVSKEIFFQDNILFVKGQEDVGLLKDHLNDMDINFFGYGIRGYTNFEFALELAKDLGIAKAAVLIDTSSDVSTPSNENTVKATLETKYGSIYKIVQWNKTDIRDKPEIRNVAKEGYFTDQGVLKPVGQLDDFQNKVNEIISYFS